MIKPRNWIFLKLLICFVIPTTLCATPQYLMTERVFNSTRRSLDVYITQTKSRSLYVRGSETRYFLHQPGRRVYGTVVIYHGYGQNPAFSSVQAQYLFSLGFNTVAFNLPGHSQASELWPGTALRESQGYDAVRKVLLNSTFIQEMLTSRDNPALTAAFLGKYGQGLIGQLKLVLAGDEFRAAREAIDVLGSMSDFNALSSNLLDLFESQHSRYDAEPYAHLALVSALPGPRYAIGYSLGGSTVTNLAGRSRAFSAIVLLAPFFAKYTSSIARAYVQLVGFVDTLNVYNGPVVVGGTAPGRCVTAAGAHALTASRDEITMAVRESTRSMCVIAADDNRVELEPALEICRSKISARKIFVYPAELKIDHAITPEGGNRFGISILDQTAKFFRELPIDDADFLVAKNFTS